jgi:Golgi nucleoside diphosphatase
VLSPFKVLSISAKQDYTVEFEIGFSFKHSLILFLAHILCRTNQLWLTYFSLPEDFVQVAGHRRDFALSRAEISQARDPH